jgi:hypothetical protein
MTGAQLGLDFEAPRLVSVTPARLGTWDDCPRRYRLTYLDRPAPVARRRAGGEHAGRGRAPRPAVAVRAAARRAHPGRGGRARRPQLDSEGFRDAEQAPTTGSAPAGGSPTTPREPAEVEPVGLRAVGVGGGRADRRGGPGRPDRPAGRRAGRGRLQDRPAVPTGEDGAARARWRLTRWRGAHAAPPCVEVELHHLPSGHVRGWRHDRPRWPRTSPRRRRRPRPRRGGRRLAAAATRDALPRRGPRPAAVLRRCAALPAGAGRGTGERAVGAAEPRESRVTGDPAGRGRALSVARARDGRVGRRPRRRPVLAAGMVRPLVGGRRRGVPSCAVRVGRTAPREPLARWLVTGVHVPSWPSLRQVVSPIAVPAVRRGAPSGDSYAGVTRPQRRQRACWPVDWWRSCDSDTSVPAAGPTTSGPRWLQQHLARQPRCGPSAVRVGPRHGQRAQRGPRAGSRSPTAVADGDQRPVPYGRRGPSVVARGPRGRRACRLSSATVVPPAHQ